VRGESFAVWGQAAVAWCETGEDGSQIISVDLAGEPEARRGAADPLAVRFTGTGVVIVQRLGDTRQLVGLLTDTKLRYRQHHQPSGHHRRRTYTQTGDCL
jgi:hypothetical protein